MRTDRRAAGDPLSQAASSRCHRWVHRRPRFPYLGTGTALLPGVPAMNFIPERVPTPTEHPDLRGPTGRARWHRYTPDRRIGVRSLRPAPPLNVMSYIDLALPAIAPCNTPSGPDQRFGGCGAPRDNTERKARSGIWIRIAGSVPIGGKVLPVPSPVAGPGARNVRARVPRRWQRFTAHSEPGEGGSCRTWEPSTSSGSSNARPPNRLRLAGLRMITPRWPLSAAIPLS